MKKIFTLLLLTLSFNLFSQLKGIVTDEKGLPLPFANIYIENTYVGTTSNENGLYELNIHNREQVVVIFQLLGYKTQKHNLKITKHPYILDVKLIEESYTLDEVVLNLQDNPANKIIRKAIEFRKENSEKTGKFTADFYSKGLFKLRNMPKKFMGQEIGDMDGLLDSTGTGIIYLSETVSKISFEKPDNLKEKIIASKISGNDNGFSYNTAGATRFDLYDNLVDFGSKVISPIADNAFNYYTYTLEGVFFDEHNHLINKIKVIPKRDNEPVFEGIIFIVEDSWAVYGVELDLKGYRIKQEFMNNMTVKQTFSYNKNSKVWAKNIQSLEIEAGAFGILFDGIFTYVYSNYDFKDSFDKKTFGREVLSFENLANKKDSIYWNNMRPVPLTLEESIDYFKKDSIQTLRKSKPYMDSIDAKNNKFKFGKLIFGYNYRNSHDKWNINYEGLIKLVHFNTVQGWNLSTGISYSKHNEETRKYYSFGARLQYGFADERFRTIGFFETRLNNKTNSYLSVTGGNQIAQFNENKPISQFVNSVSTLFFKDNYMKLYEKNFVKATYQQEVVNGLYLWSSLEYGERNPLFNNTDYIMIKRSKEYTSNNPVASENHTDAIIEKHNLVKFNVTARINFGQKYYSRPDGKYNIRNSKYPSIFATYEKGFAGNEDHYNYNLISGRIFYERTLANKGNIALNFKAGKFFNAENISFVDYKHFNGNQTHVNNGDRYLNVYNLLPYYSHSTNDSYTEIHTEYNDEGYFMNKIPLLNKLKSTMILGYHQLGIPEIKPYQEFSVGLDRLGFGKFKIFRLDYIRSYQGSYYAGDGFIFGIKLLDALN